jgi:Ulp1 family protease
MSRILSTVANARSLGKRFCDFQRFNGKHTIVFIAHRPGHWVTLVVDVNAWDVVLWDSINPRRWPTRDLPKGKIGAFLRSAFPNKGDPTFSIAKNCPLQSHLVFGGFGANCGVYAIEFARAILFGTPLTKVSEVDMEGNRAHIINELKSLKIIRK